MVKDFIFVVLSLFTMVVFTICASLGANQLINFGDLLSVGFGLFIYTFVVVVDTIYVLWGSSYLLEKYS